MLVSQLMDLCCPTVSPDATPSQIAASMRGENSGIVMVCDAQKHVLGVITDRDMIMHVFCAQNPHRGHFAPPNGTPAADTTLHESASSAMTAKNNNSDSNGAPGATTSVTTTAPCMPASSAATTSVTTAAPVPALTSARKTTASPTVTAAAIMTTPVVTAAPCDDIHDAALLMSKHGICRLPVVENERLVGLLTLRSLAKQRLYIAEIGHIIYNKARRD